MKKWEIDDAYHSWAKRTWRGEQAKKERDAKLTESYIKNELRKKHSRSKQEEKKETAEVIYQIDENRDNKLDGSNDCDAPTQLGEPKIDSEKKRLTTDEKFTILIVVLMIIYWIFAE